MDQPIDGLVTRVRLYSVKVWGPTRPEAGVSSEARSRLSRSPPVEGSTQVQKSPMKAKVVEFGNYEIGTSAGFLGDMALLRLESCLGKEYGHLEIDRQRAYCSRQLACRSRQTPSPLVPQSAAVLLS
jgi:hypothetical protein